MNVSEWMKANGGPRRFKTGDTADPFALKPWLMQRGYELLTGKGMLTVKRVGAKGKAARLSRPAFFEFVDGLRTRKARNQSS